MSIDSREVVRVKNVLHSLGFKTDAQITKGLKNGSINPSLPLYGKASHNRMLDHFGLTPPVKKAAPVRKKAVAKKPEKNQAKGAAGYGGARKGAGRKPSATTSKARKIADKLIENNEITPLEYMLGTLRETPEKLKAQYDAGDLDTIQYTLALQDLTRRKDKAAESAASYIHPRLSSIDANVGLKGHDAFIALMAEAAEK